MKIEVLQKDKITAMKNKDEMRKSVLTDMIDMVQKASITNKGMVEITEALVDETLIKYQKMTQEMIDTCPADRTDKLNQYNAAMAIVKEYAPQLISDEATISEMIKTIVGDQFEFTKANRGNIMKIVMPELKGKVDMAIANKTLGSMFK
jgi:uncharacterized protein YqeY